jgi:hypothetical protein
MRRVMGLAAAGVVLLAAATGCGPIGATAGAVLSAQASPMPTAPLPPGDPMITRQVCASATAAAAYGSTAFNDRLATIEQAAAHGDQSTLVEAAEEIQHTLVNLAISLRFLAQKSVSPRVKAALLQGTTVLTEISSEAYAGSTTDTRQRLADLVTNFRRACS